MIKSSYEGSTHYSREDGARHGVVVAQPDGMWLSIRYGSDGINAAKMHETRWLAERELEGFHTITTGNAVISRDDISTIWRNAEGQQIAIVQEIAPQSWDVETLYHNHERQSVSVGHRTHSREEAESYVSRNF